MQDDFEAWVNEVEFCLVELNPEWPRVPRPLPTVGTDESRVVMLTLIAALQAIGKGDIEASYDTLARAQEFVG